MTLTIALSTGAVFLIVASAMLFIAVTVFCGYAGLFDGGDTYGIGALFTLAIYAILWAIPSLVAWGVWAMWFRV